MKSCLMTLTLKLCYNLRRRFRFCNHTHWCTVNFLAAHWLSINQELLWLAITTTLRQGQKWWREGNVYPPPSICICRANRFNDVHPNINVVSNNWNLESNNWIFKMITTDHKEVEAVFVLMNFHHIFSAFMLIHVLWLRKLLPLVFICPYNKNAVVFKYIKINQSNGPRWSPHRFRAGLFWTCFLAALW